MKKSKVIIPALGVLVLSTAASVTGTVAWFTANRTATITAGEFAVVNTNSNLEVTLSNGIGVNVDSANKIITQKNKKTLTDSSFDHTVDSRTVVVPDASRQTVGQLLAFNQYSEANFLRSGTVDADKTGVFTAFAWDITFSITFPGGAVYDMGLFLDLSASYAHEKVTFANGYAYTANDAGDYKKNADLSGDTVTIPNSGSSTQDQTLYKATPDATGKGFRLAFIPKTVAGANDIGYAKVWAPNQIGANTKFVDTDTPTALAVGNPLREGAAYGTNTMKITNGSASVENLGAAKVLMASDVNNTDAVPQDHAQTHAASRDGNANYLGFMKLNPGATSSMTFTCLAWYEGTDPEIVAAATNFEKIVLGMKFAAVELAA